MAKPFKPGFFSNLNGIKDNNDRPPLVGGSGGGTTNTFTNLGLGARIFAALVGDDVRFRTITVGTNLSVTENPDTVNIAFTGTLGEVNTMSNLGATGARVFSAKTGVDFALRRILAAAGSGITVTENTNDISIGTNPSVLATLLAPLLGPLLTLGEANTASNRGAGQGVFAAKVGVDLQFKSLVAGTNVVLTSDANTITIESSGGGGGGVSGTPAAIRNQVSAEQEIPINTPTIILFPTNNHDTTVDLSYSAGVVTTVTGGVHHMTTMVRVETPPVGAVSDTRLTLEVSNAAQTVWTVVAEDLQIGTIASNSSATFQCSTDWNLPAGAGVRTRLSYQSTLSGVLRVVFPIGSEPVGHLGVHRVAVADQIAYTGLGLGTGQGAVFKELVGNEFRFRTLRAGANTTITQDANEITIASTGGGGSSVTSLNKQFYMDDLEATSNTGTTLRFVPNAGGTGATISNTVASLITEVAAVNGAFGVFRGSAASTANGFAQIISNPDTARIGMVFPNGKIAGYGRGILPGTPSTAVSVGLSIFSDSPVLPNATTVKTGSFVGFKLGVGWFIVTQNGAIGTYVATALAGVPLPTTNQVFEMYLEHDDSLGLFSYRITVNGTLFTGTVAATYNFATLYPQAALLDLVPFRFGLYNDGTTPLGANILLDTVGYGYDFTNTVSAVQKRMTIPF